MDIPLISHIGIAVKDFEKALAKYSLLLDERKPDIHIVTEQKVKAAIFKGGCCGGGARVELVTPTTDDSPIAKYLDTKGEGLHHICIYV
ncbi:MAG TPA: methylmalonyl-CoA epimerase, partial [candidate division Zixibacteria bacterium]|nr:methylmalonyl-CoA epimerase [candidate division Zixibacteria bacterium]